MGPTSQKPPTPPSEPPSAPGQPTNAHARPQSGGSGGAEPASRDARAIIVATASVVGAVVLLSVLAARRVNHVALAAAPRSVMVIAAGSATYRDTRTYVGSVRPWIEASVGPQYISAYVLTILVRPGAVVKRGDVLATLDCADPSAATRAFEMKARAVDARRKAAENEAARLAAMLDGGFVAPNDVEQKAAVGLSEHAQLLETQANVLRSSLDVRDCTLRAPFDGEIGVRTVDPGAFVRPGAAIVSVVDRRIVRIAADAPEKDFDAIAPSTPVRLDILATGAHLAAAISRRSPRADPSTRTVSFEVDVPNPKRQYPTETTALVHIDVSEPVSATRIPIYAATQEHGNAKVFVVEDDVARERTIHVLGEMGGTLFFESSALPAGALVVTEGRALLSDGNRVQARSEEPALDDGGSARSEARGGGHGQAP